MVRIVRRIQSTIHDNIHLYVIINVYVYCIIHPRNREQTYRNNNIANDFSCRPGTYTSIAHTIYFYILHLYGYVMLLLLLWVCVCVFCIQNGFAFISTLLDGKYDHEYLYSYIIFLHPFTSITMCVCAVYISMFVYFSKNCKSRTSFLLALGPCLCVLDVFVSVSTNNKETSKYTFIAV